MTETIVNLEQLLPHAEKLTAARFDLEGTVNEMEAAIVAVKRQFKTRIANKLGKYRELRDELRGQVERNPHLFDKPRTHNLAGFKLGFQKQKGRLVVTNEDRTFDLIHKHFPEQEELLVQVVKKLNKSAINKLAVGDLRKIGCQIEESGDEVLVKPIDSDVDKIIARLLDDDQMKEAA